MTSSVGAHSWVGFTTSSRNSAWMTAGSRRIFGWLGPCLMTCWPGLGPGSPVRTPTTGAPYQLRSVRPPSLCQWRRVKLNADWLSRLSVTRRSVKRKKYWTPRVGVLGALFRCKTPKSNALNALFNACNASTRLNQWFPMQKCWFSTPLTCVTRSVWPYLYCGEVLLIVVLLSLW